MLTDKIQDDLTLSLKSKAQDKVDVLRLILAEIKNAEIEKGETLTDEEAQKIIKGFVKKLREAADMFKEGGRDDLAKQNEDQERVAAEYLPAEMSDAELKSAIDALIDENKEIFEKNPNALIGIAMKKLSAQADSQRILAELKSR